MVLIPWAVFVTETQCFLCGLSNVCLAMEVGCVLALSLLEDLPIGAGSC